MTARQRLSVGLMAACLATPAWAEAAGADPADAPPEIVVTAQRRTERLQDVPVSVSALTGDALQKSRLTQADDLVLKIPNLQLSSTVGEGTPIFSLRGVSMSDFSLNQSGPVATYYDEVYKGNFALLGVSMFDLERVEVLRGPQGTLYGKNTTGGAVNLISRRPSLDAVDGYLTLGYGNYGRHEAAGAVNLPLGPYLAGRIAFSAARQSGWFSNRLPGGPDLNAIREYAVRGSLLWEPAPGTSFLLRAATSFQNPRNYGIYAQEGPDGIGAGVYEAFGSGASYYRAGLGRRTLESNFTPRRRIRTHAVSLTSVMALGGDLSLTGVTSWDKGRLTFGEDTDGAPTRTLESSYGDRVTQFAQDLRLTSDLGGPIDFILGAYFNREKLFNTTEIGFFQDLDATGDGLVDSSDCIAAFPFGCRLVNSFDQIKHSYALYTDLQFRLAEHFVLRGGLRFTRDDGTQSDLVSNAFGNDGMLVANPIPATSRRFKNNRITGKIGLDYKISPNNLIYGNYSRGYRGASFNAQAYFSPAEATIAKPETLDAFEIGAKTQSGDRRFTLNLSAFYYRYRNQQFVNVSPQTAVITLVNVERSRIYGGEAELSLRLDRRASFQLGVGLLNSRISKGVLSGQSLAGNRLSNAPALSASASADITLLQDTAVGKLSIAPSISYVSSQYFEVLNKPMLKQGGYALLSGALTWEQGRLSASLWAKNLANRFYTTSRVDTLDGFGYIYNHIGAPRTYGITGTVRF